MTRWLIDGMNVIGAQGASAGPWWRDRPGAQRALAERVGAWAAAAAQDDEVRIVFDGAPHEIVVEGVDVRFATTRGRDAADKDLAAAAGPGATVVTSDGALADAARRAGAEVMGAGAFLRILAL